MKKETLKDIYNFEYEDLPYGLPMWFNRLIDKTSDQIDMRDVFTMMRQNILPEVAIEQAISLFILNPFDGEIFDGQLLELFIKNSEMFFKSKNPLLSKMLEIIESMDDETAQSKEQWGYDYDYCEEDCKNYLELLGKARVLICKRSCEKRVLEVQNDEYNPCDICYVKK